MRRWDLRAFVHFIIPKLLLGSMVFLVVLSAQSAANALYSSEAEFRAKLIANPSWAVVSQWPSMGPAAVDKSDLRSKINVFAPFGYNEEWINCCWEGSIVVQPGDTREWAVPPGVLAYGTPHRHLHGYDIVQLQYLFQPHVRLTVFKTSSKSFISQICGNPSPVVYFPPGTLVIRKFDDSNANAVWDSGEPEISGWNVSYSGPNNGSGLTPFTVTVPRGSYTVTEENRQGWVHTTSAMKHVTVESCQTASATFGNIQISSIAGVKFDDTNCNGILDGVEEILPGWEICLSGNTVAGGEVDLGPMPTDENGAYRFDNLYPSDGFGYTVSEILADSVNWGPTHPLDPNLIEVPYTLAPRPHVIVLGEGVDRTDVNFGNVRLGKISGFKFYDANPELPVNHPNNGNGVYDPGEPFLMNWAMQITGNCDLELPITPRTLYTDKNGEFTFTRLYPSHVGQGYTICEELPDPWIITAPQTQCRDIHLDEGQEITTGFEFGNIKRDESDVRTIGYWKNHPEAITKAMYQVLSDLPAFPHVNNWKKLEPILWDANAEDMTVMLRAQLAAMELNVIEGFVSLDATVYVGDISGAPELFGGNIIYLETILDVIESAYPWDGWDRSIQETAKDALDHANNDENMVLLAP